jgi:hypothetical protein
MLSLPSAFLSIANKVSSVMGAPFFDGVIITQTPAVIDDGGSIVTPGGVDRAPCRVQIDSVDEAYRKAAGWADTDFTFIIVAASIGVGDLTGIAPVFNTDAEVQIPSGPRAGQWQVSSLTMDPASIGWAGKGRLSG